MSFKYFEFYKDHLALSEQTKPEVNVKCIFHKDITPSLGVNLETGLWKCHSLGCETNKIGAGGGDVYKFYMYAHKDEGVTYENSKALVNEKYKLAPEAKKDKDKKKAVKLARNFPITQDEIEAKHKALLESKKVMAVLTEEFGWSEEVIKKFKLGFQDPRLWIPITEYGKIVNIRKYCRKPADGNKVISVAGFGDARMWPLEALDQEVVYLFEGEKDCITAHSVGLNGITVTGGAGTFNMKWSLMFEKRKVVICYDIDEAGRKGAEVVAQYLLRTASEVKVIYLPIEEPANADFTDYIMAGATKEDFLALVERTEPVARENDSRVPDEVIELSVAKAVEKKLFYRRIKSKIRVVSKMETPSLLPGVLNFTCTRAFGKACYSCDNYATGASTVHLDEKSIVTLRLLTSSVKESKSLYKEVFKVPRTCEAYQVVETDHQYVEDVLSSPVVEECSRKDMFRQRFEEHQMFILNTALDVNTDYDIESVMYEHPVDRRIVHLVYRIAPCLSTLENLDLNENALKALEGFQYEQRVNTAEVG